MTSIPTHIKALFILLLIPIIWGLTFPIIKMALPYINAELFVAIRCLLAILSLLPFIAKRLFKISKKSILQGLILGALTGATFISQTQGLKTLDPASSAFITGIGVIFVPFLLPLFGLGKPKFIHYICALLFLLGLYILTGASLNQNLIGVLWTLACAFFYAVFVVYLQKVKPNKDEVLVLAFYQVIASFLLASLVSVNTSFHIVLNLYTIGALLFCGVIATSFIVILQTRYQQYVPANQVILIYSLEALFASLFSYFIIHEQLTMRLLIGGAMMLSSVLINEFNSSSLQATKSEEPKTI